MFRRMAVQRLGEHPSTRCFACTVRPIEDIDGPDLPLENGIGQRLHNQALPNNVLESPGCILLSEAPVPATLRAPRLLPRARLGHEVGIQLAALVGENPELPREAPGNGTDAIPRPLGEQRQ